MEEMEDKIFWSTGRRKYLSRILANLSLLLVGAIGTSEIFKLTLGIKFAIATAALAMIITGTIIHPKKNKEEI